MMIENEDGSGNYSHSPEPYTVESVNDGSKTYGGLIYTQRFLSKWVYRTNNYTMVCANTQCDGNRFLMIFDNEKECKDNSLKKLYVENWA